MEFVGNQAELAVRPLEEMDEESKKRKLEPSEPETQKFAKVGESGVAANDEIEASNLLAALSVYKSIYETNKLPTNFVVPSNDDEWPETTWGMQLGTQVEGILCNMIVLAAEERSEFDKLRIELASTSSVIKSVKEANAAALAVSIANTTAGAEQASSSSNDNKEEPVVEDADDAIAFDKVYKALVAYKAIHGCLSVSPKYTIPSGDHRWPQDIWGMQIGAQVILSRMSPDQKDKLEKLGLDMLSPLITGKKHPSAMTILETLKTFKEIFGNLKVQRGFIVPSEQPWPEGAWGCLLDSKLEAIKRGSHAKYRAQWEELGIDFSNQRERERSLLEFCVRAVEDYRNIYGNVDIPREYILPLPEEHPDERWTKDLLGLKLGRSLFHIFNNTIFETSELEELGIEPRAWRKYDTNDIYMALQTYQQIYASVEIQKAFTIPVENPSWPSEWWGMPLGERLHNLKVSGSHHDEGRQQVLDLGFKVVMPKEQTQNNRNFTSTFEKTVEALKYYKEYTGNLKIPQEFIVPSNVAWPERLHGLKLGLRLICYRHHSPLSAEQRKSLEDLGVVMTIRKRIKHRGKQPIETHVEALTNFKRLNDGSCKVPRAFVVPMNDPSWDSKLWGLPLGESIRNIRRGAFKEHAETFRAMGLHIPSNDELAEKKRNSKVGALVNLGVTPYSEREHTHKSKQQPHS